MKSYTSLKEMLITRLGAIKGKDDGTLFTGVYGATTQAIAGYPHALVLERAGAGNLIDTHRNEREWQFSVIIRQGVGSQIRTPEEAYEVLLDAVDRTLAMFDEDPQLRNDDGLAQVKDTRVVPVEFTFDAAQESAVHQATLAIAMVDIVNRFN